MCIGQIVASRAHRLAPVPGPPAPRRADSAPLFAFALVAFAFVAFGCFVGVILSNW